MRSKFPFVQTLLILFSDYSDVESSVLIGQESAWSAQWSRGTRTPTRHSTRFVTGLSSRTATGTNKLGELNALKIKLLEFYFYQHPSKDVLNNISQFVHSYFSEFLRKRKFSKNSKICAKITTFVTDIQSKFG